MERRGKNRKEKTQKTESDLVTIESFGATCAMFSFLALLILFTRSLIFGNIGLHIHSFLTGFFGYFAYPVFFGALYLCSMLLIGKSLVKNKKAGLFIALSVVFAGLIAHTAFTFSWQQQGYLGACFDAGKTFPATTVTGWLGGLLVYALSALLTRLGALLVLCALCGFFVYLAVVSLKKKTTVAETTQQKTQEFSTEIPVTIPENEGNAYNTQQRPAFSFEKQKEAEVATGYVEPQTQQRPGVSIADSAPKQTGAYSPFGTADSMQDSAPTREREYRRAKEELFGMSPGENYRTNLIYQPSANVNNLPPIPPTPPMQSMQTQQPPQTLSGYAPSYTDAYENSVNEGSQQRPMKIVSDHYTESYPSYAENSYAEKPYEEKNNDPYSLRKETSYAEKTVYQDSYYEEPKRESEYLNVAPVAEIREEPPMEEKKEVPSESEYRRHEFMDTFSLDNPNIFGRTEDDTPIRDTLEEFSGRNEYNEYEDRRGSRTSEWEDLTENRSDRTEERSVLPEEDTRLSGGINMFDEPENDPYTLRSDYNEEVEKQSGGYEPERMEPPVLNEDRRENSPIELDYRGREEKEEIPPTLPLDRGRGYDMPVEPIAQVGTKARKPRKRKPYVKVPLEYFNTENVAPTINENETEEIKQTILGTLEDFKITGASIASVAYGPTVTRYNVTLPRHISPRKVVALDQSIAINLYSSGVSIYPNYKDGVVSIEVPNKTRQFVQLGSMLSGKEFTDAKPSSLMFAMGKDVANGMVYGDISKMIHMLVAGSSGSGKSVFLGALIISLIYKYSPDELRLILIDPKKTEFVLYNNLPHLLINEIITEADKAVQTLSWAINEMNRRYGEFEKMSRSGTYVVNLDQYNAKVEKEERMPKIVIIIDELADLMLEAKKDVEDKIQNLTQKARAAGIHLIVATQRPSVDVITGVIKSNLATRISFMVATEVDSRVILDQTGAQKLLGQGDMLYTMQGVAVPVRVQSAFISPDDSQKIVDYIKENNEAYYDEEIAAFINKAKSGGSGGSSSDSDAVEPVYIDALRYVIANDSASISMIQRKFSVGYNKAGKIVEWMEEKRFISPYDGAKARKVLITQEDFEKLYGPF